MPTSTPKSLLSCCLFVASFGCANGDADGEQNVFSASFGSPTTVGTESSGDTDCPQGALGCPCTDGGFCDGELVCEEDMCTEPSGDGDGEGTGDGDGEGTGDGDGEGTGDGDGEGTGDGDGDPCGGQCADGETCVDGECTLACGPQELACDGQCIDPLTDMDYCGALGDCLGANAGVACDPEPASSCPGALGETCQAGACAPGCVNGGESFEATGMIEELALPECVVEIHVLAAGAQGGSSTQGSAGGLGAQIEGDVCVSPGTTLSILVGEQAPSALYPAGGGGGSFVVDGMGPLFVAGGGGGGYYDWAPGGNASALAQGGPGVGGQSYNDGGGGGGYSSDGQGTQGTGGLSFQNGGAGGSEYPANNQNTGPGGFGGGGGSSQSGSFNAGGGGGYDGGSAGNGNASTGGTSWSEPNAANVEFTPATNVGDGSVEISW